MHGEATHLPLPIRGSPHKMCRFHQLAPRFHWPASGHHSVHHNGRCATDLTSFSLHSPVLEHVRTVAAGTSANVEWREDCLCDTLEDFGNLRTFLRQPRER